MPRSPLPLGTWDQINTHVVKTDPKGKPSRHQPRAKFRDFDGRTRLVSAEGRSITAAGNNLRKKLQERAKTRRTGELTAMHRVSRAIALWDKRFQEKIDAGERSPGSLQTYRNVAANHIIPAIGELRLGEANTPRIDDLIADIRRTVGATTARTCRSILSGVMGLAVRYGALSTHPVRDVEAIESKAKKSPRALTTAEVRLVRDQLASNDRAVQADLPDLVTFMLGTGARIGETLAVHWDQVDLDNATIQIAHTIVRITGQGLIRKITKSDAGQREVHIPAWTVACLRTRAATGIRLDQPVFADLRGSYRDPSNICRSLRTALTPVGSTARRNLGTTLHTLRRQAKLTRTDITHQRLAQEQTPLIETGRIRLDRPAATNLLRLCPTDPAVTEALAQVDEAAQPVAADALAWIKSHAFRKTTATALDTQGQTARQIADHLGHSRVSMTQDNYLGRKSHNPQAAEALQRAFEDPDPPSL